jgi:hypothetical protein
MSIRDFLVGSKHEDGNYHYTGETSNAFVAPRPSDVDRTVDKIIDAMPALMSTYLIKRSIFDSSDRVIDSVFASREPTPTEEALPTALATLGLPALIGSGMYTAVKHSKPERPKSFTKISTKASEMIRTAKTPRPKSTIAAVMRALRLR